MAERAVFSPMIVAALIVVGLLSFLGAILIFTYGEDSGQATTVDANAYSRSAIGHRAFVDLLKRLDIPVLVSRYRSAEKALYQDVLMVMEPDATEEAMEDILTADMIIVVLPKWRGGRSREKPLWLGRMSLIDEEKVNRVLKSIDPEAAITRPEEKPVWAMSEELPDPDLPDPQLISGAGTGLAPLLTSDRGILVGELQTDDQTIWVVSDPDLFSNHGLARGDNAVIAVNLVALFRAGDQGLVIDETLHGFQIDPNLIRSALRFPFVLATVLGLAAIGFLVWAATGRFGAPLPVGKTLAPGKATLIENTAGLLEFGKHNKEVLRQYLERATHEVALAVHAPKNLYGRALVEWLDRVGRGQGQKIPCKTVYNRADVVARSDYADGGTLLKVAQDIYHWKKEMLHGPRNRPGHQ